LCLDFRSVLCFLWWGCHRLWQRVRFVFPTVSEMRLDGFELPSTILHSSICFFIVSRSNFGLFSNGSLLLCLVGSPNS
jgi:hypothetical protein